jgi:hypothetical protein
MEQSVPKRRHINFRRRGITQKKAYSILMSSKLCHETLAQLAPDTVWETLRYTVNKYGEAELKGPLLASVLDE